jgi:hypothetical protein
LSLYGITCKTSNMGQLNLNDKLNLFSLKGTTSN